MTVRPDRDTTDADLVAAAAAGDRIAFAAIYDRYANRLHDFCVGMLRDRDAAADCVQDAFCTAATKLTQLRDPDKLRPWLDSIARNEALRHQRERRREEPTDMLPELETTEAGPEILAREVNWPTSSPSRPVDSPSATEPSSTSPTGTNSTGSNWPRCSASAKATQAPWCTGYVTPWSAPSAPCSSPAGSEAPPRHARSWRRSSTAGTASSPS
ncbi:MAG: hypothetical protein QOI28_132 [Mycobacterium sp.]|nr:hypothetical protein [Mycobacterium sp.]